MTESTGAPLLRWLSRPSSKDPSPSSSTTNLSSPSLISLNEALHEPLPLPRRLPEAHFSVSQPPPFFDNLTRSTLPSASLSPPATISSFHRSASPPVRTRSTSPSNELDTPQIKLTNSPPSRSSLDTLRTVSRRDSTRRQSQSRSHSTTSTSAIFSSDSSDTNTNNSWWWFQSGNKDNVDDLLAEEDRADTVREEQDNIRRKYHSTRDPIVFCHGLLGFDSVTIGPSIAPMQVMHWRGIKEVLEANGTEVLITRVPATSSPIERAKVLEQKISEVYPGRTVHLIGHSMGGIDCRYLTTHLTKRKFSVSSITTIATPHRGSSFADHFISTLGKGRMDSFLSLLDLLPNGGGDGKAFECLTLESMRRFNEEVPDVPGVKYFSWGSVYEPGLVDTWKWSHSVVLEKEGPNDGLVSIKSARWGKYLGTLQNVNHLDLVGWINPARFKWAQMTGKDINFRPATFYLGIVDMLAKEVDGVETENDGFYGNDNTENEAGKGADIKSDSSSSSSSLSNIGTRSKRNSTSATSRATEPLETRAPPDKGSTLPSSGHTELIFATDQGENIDKVVLRTGPPSNSNSNRLQSPFSLPSTANSRERKTETSVKQKRTSLLSSLGTLNFASDPSLPNRSEGKPSSQAQDGILPAWATRLGDSIASLASQSSSPSSSNSRSNSGSSTPASLTRL